jgi:hypothetical protein
MSLGHGDAQVRIAPGGGALGESALSLAGGSGADPLSRQRCLYLYMPKGSQAGFSFTFTVLPPAPHAESDPNLSFGNQFQYSVITLDVTGQAASSAKSLEKPELSVHSIELNQASFESSFESPLDEWTVSEAFNLNWEVSPPPTPTNTPTPTPTSTQTPTPTNTPTPAPTSTSTPTPTNTSTPTPTNTPTNAPTPVPENYLGGNDVNIIVTVDGRKWILVRRQNLNGQDYAMLMYKDYEPDNLMTFLDNAYYDAPSDLRKKIESLHKKYAGPYMRANAVIPGYAELTPPKGLLDGNNPQVFFAPNLGDARASRDAWETQEYGFLLSTAAGKNTVYYAMGGENWGIYSTLVGKNVYLPASLYARPCVWVRY